MIKIICNPNSSSPSWFSTRFVYTPGPCNVCRTNTLFWQVVYEYIQYINICILAAHYKHIWKLLWKCLCYHACYIFGLFRQLVKYIPQSYNRTSVYSLAVSNFLLYVEWNISIMKLWLNQCSACCLCFSDVVRLLYEWVWGHRDTTPSREGRQTSAERVRIPASYNNEKQIDSLGFM